MKKTLLTFLVLISFCGFTQTVELVKDINLIESSAAGNFGKMFSMNNVAYFFADDEIHGYELWRSDGTDQGTYLLKDIIQGKLSSRNRNAYGENNIKLAVLNNKMYFLATNEFEINGNPKPPTIWTTDGTVQNTEVFLFQTSGNYKFNYPAELTTCNNIIYFQANTIEVSTNTELGRMPWRTDGTAAGTFPLFDTQVNVFAENFTVVNGLVFFKSQKSIWKTDGTKAGTVFVKSINPGNGYIPLVELTEANGLLFFREEIANNYGGNLFRSDGTNAGTFELVAANPNFRVKSLKKLNNQLIFAAFDGEYRTENPNCNSWQLWKSDGTEVGTTLLKNIFTDVQSDYVYGSYPKEITALNNKLYFMARATISSWGLYETNGTAAGTLLVKALTQYASEPEDLNTGNGLLFFLNSSTGTGEELWKSDGTSAGTTITKDIFQGNGSSFDSGNGHYLGLSNSLLFFATDKYSNFKLWKSDGTNPGTVLVKDIIKSNQDSDPKYLTELNGEAYFEATYDYVSPNILKGLFKTDGTNTVMVSDGNASFITKTNNFLYFLRNSRLYKSDGTAIGTTMVSPDYSYTLIASYNNEILFKRSPPFASHLALWKSNGNEEGTVMLKNWGDGNLNFGRHYKELNGIFYFEVDYYNNQIPSSSFGNELWRTDGTTEGTYMVKDINPGGESSLASNPYLTVRNSSMYFLATHYNTNSSFYQLWKTDGTDAGTVNVTDNVNHTSGFVSVTNVNGTLFLIDKNGNLWKSDGTSLGTVLVKNGFNAVYPSVSQLNNQFYFTGNTTANGLELWKSDGTDIGTLMVKDIKISSDDWISSSGITNLFSHNNKLYFSANDYLTGNELWETDGTDLGTKKYEIFDFEHSSDPKDFFSLGNKLLFSAMSPHGRELWKLVPNPCPSALAITTNYSSGTETPKASAVNGLITATNQITNAAKITYQARSMLLSPGFKAQPADGGYFKTEIGGCN